MRIVPTIKSNTCASCVLGPTKLVVVHRPHPYSSVGMKRPMSGGSRHRPLIRVTTYLDRRPETYGPSVLLLDLRLSVHVQSAFKDAVGPHRHSTALLPANSKCGGPITMGIWPPARGERLVEERLSPREQDTGLRVTNACPGHGEDHDGWFLREHCMQFGCFRPSSLAISAKLGCHFSPNINMYLR